MSDRRRSNRLRKNAEVRPPQGGAKRVLDASFLGRCVSGPDPEEQVFVLRCQLNGGLSQGGRISLYDSGSGERQHFASLEALLRYLARRLTLSPDAPGTPHSRPEEDK